MHRFTLGVEEEFQIVDPRDLGAPFARHRAARDVGAGARRSDQARAASVDRRGRHADLCRRRRAPRRDLPHPPRAGAGGRARRARRRRGRHPPVLALEGPGPLPRRPLRQHRRGAAAAGAVAAHLRPPRPRRRARPHDDDRPDERSAVLPAAPAGAVHQLAVLDGPRHRAEVLPHDDLPSLSAHRRAGPFRVVERLRELRAPARRPALHRRRAEDLVGRAAAPDLRHARVPRLRRADAARGRRDAGGADPGDHRQAVPPARPQPGLPPLSPGAHRREQVARGAVGARRQADRLRQGRGSADARPRGRAARLHRRRRRRPGQPLGGRVRAHRAARRNQRRSAARRLSRHRGSDEPSSATSSSRRSRMRAEGCRDEWSTRRDADEGRPAVRPRVQLPAGVHRAGERGGRAARDHRRDGQAWRHEDGRPRRVPGDRRSHLPRSGVLPRRVEARGAAGLLRDQQPVLVDRRRQVLQLLGDGEARRRHPEDRAAAAEGLPGGRRPHRRSRCTTSRFRWTGTRCSTTSAARPS